MKLRKEHVTHPDRSLRFLRFELDALALPRHAHHHVELTWIERGHGLRLVGDDAGPFEAGDLVLLGPQVPHTWLTSTGRQHPRPAVSVIQFEPEWITQSLSPELRRAVHVLQGAERGLQLRGRTARAVRQVMTQMRDADDYTRLAGLVQIVGHLVASAPRDRIAIAAARTPAPGRTEQPRRTDRVIDWMQRHLADELRVDDAARLAHVTPAAFSRWFKREVGKTFTQYLNDMRFGAACVRLRQSQRPIAAVAAECGFATMSHFNRQFLLRARMTPREYRRGAAGRDAQRPA
jgi:AraC-like DNA-binding protein